MNLKEELVYLMRFLQIQDMPLYLNSCYAGRLNNNLKYIPFTAETEYLIGTTQIPKFKYRLSGIKSYFNGSIIKLFQQWVS